MDYKSIRWIKLRAKILRRDGYACQYFKMYGRMVPANTVHHIYPCEFYPEYQWCEWNLVALSNEAHNMMHYRDTHKLTEKGELLKIKANQLRHMSGDCSKS